MPSTPVTITGVLTWSEAGSAPPPSIWPSPGVPTNPIVIPQPPPSVWPSPGYPSQPIYLPSPPPGVVSPPIYLPPQIWPTPPGGGGPPVGIWPSPGQPANPIYLPPGMNIPTFPGQLPVLPGAGTPPSEGGGGPQWVYSPTLGWIIVWVPPGEGGKPQPPLEPPIASQLPS